jgi:hypothetical protein
MYTDFRWENLKEREHFDNVHVNGKIIWKAEDLECEGLTRIAQCVCVSVAVCCDMLGSVERMNVCCRAMAHVNHNSQILNALLLSDFKN